MSENDSLFVSENLGEDSLLVPDIANEDSLFVTQNTEQGSPSGHMGTPGDEPMDVDIPAPADNDVSMATGGDDAVQVGHDAHEPSGEQQDNEEEKVKAPPVQSVHDVERYILEKALEVGLDRFLGDGGRHFSVITLCSGTDAPVMAIGQFQEAAVAQLNNFNMLSCSHISSVEIDPVKQAFIRRNARPEGNIYRDVVEFAKNEWATTAAGFKAKVPTEVDLLIIGSSCVDFSALNPKKSQKAQGLPDFADDIDPDFVGVVRTSLNNVTGESIETFLASVLCAGKMRPRLMMLENVSNAPWVVIAKYIEKIGYSAAVVQLDSRHFGLPHTRQRGYLVAASSSYYGQDADAIVQRWAKVIKHIRPECQIPLENLILGARDRPIREMAIPIERGVAREPTNKATMCKMRHKVARDHFTLPDAQPLTRLDDRGMCVIDDNSLHAWIMRQGLRFNDLSDIMWLRILLSSTMSFDARRKLMVIDMSQNVDRSLGQIGQTPCLTPNGIPFLTGQGRPLIGREAMALQGFEPAKLVPSTETEKEWRDLAGNAMTTTVVGSAILALMIAEADICRGKENGLKEPAKNFIESHKSPGDAIFFDQTLTEVTDEYFAGAERSFHGTVGEFLDLWKCGRSLCPCDGLSMRNRGKHLELCRDCGEIHCNVCRGNPQHNYEPYLAPEVLSSEAQTKERLRVSFPPKFTLTVESQADGLKVPPLHYFQTTHISERMSINFALSCESVTYYYQSSHVGQVLTVFYRSTSSFAHVVIDQDSVSWTVYVDNPERRGELEAVAEEVPAHRVVQAKLNGRGRSHIPTEWDWALWVDERHEIDVEVDESVPRPEKIKYNHVAYRDSQGQPYLHPNVKENVEAALARHFQLTEKCGTPHHLLYFRNDDLAAPLYHFQDPMPCTLGSSDKWVIAHTNRKLELFEMREVILEFPPSFIPLHSKWHRLAEAKRGEKKTTEAGRVVEMSLEEPDQHTEEKLNAQREAEKKAAEAAKEAAKCEATASTETKSQAKSNGKGKGKEAAKVVKELLSRFTCISPGYWCPASVSPSLMSVAGSASPRIITHRERVFKEVDRDFEEYGCDQVKTLLHLEIPNNNLPFKSRFHEILWTTARSSPHAPLPMHQVRPHDKDELLRLISYAFRAAPIKSVQSREYPLRDSWCPTCAPVSPAVHRVRSDAGKVELVISDQVECERFEESVNARRAPLNIFVAKDQQTGKLEVCLKWNVFSLVHRALGHLPREGPEMGVQRDLLSTTGMFKIEHNFIDKFGGFTPFEECLGPVLAEGLIDMTLPSFPSDKKLRPDQQKCVAWMLDRENKPQPFVEREVEEHTEAAIGLRLVGRVQRENTARGGILAHEVGFGKTVVILALLDEQRNSRFDVDSIQERQAAFGESLIHLKATLIVVPHHILGQWEHEITTFLMRAQMKKADIILASERALKFKTLQRDNFARAGAQPPMHGPDNSRNYHDFHTKACVEMRKIQHFVRSTNADRDAADRDIHHRVMRNQEILDKAEENHVEPSKRKKGKARYRPKKPAKSAKPMSKGQVVTTQNVEAGLSTTTHTAASWNQGRDENTDERPAKARKTSRGSTAGQALAKKARDSTGGMTAGSRHIEGRLLEMYSFARIVFDEFGFKDVEVAIAIGNLAASATWLLSGTPPLYSLSSICFMASMLKVHIARMEPALPDHLPEITQGPSPSDMSRTEAFRAWRQLKTGAFAHERHEQALEFVKHFMRKSPAVMHQKFRVIQKVVFVRRETMAQANYLRLQTCLYYARWDLELLSSDGLSLLSLIMTDALGKKKDWAKGLSRQEKYDAVIRALLLHTTLALEKSYIRPRFKSYASKKGKEKEVGGPGPAGEPRNAGETVGDALSWLVEDARLTVARLMASTKYQFDRLSYLAHQFRNEPEKLTASEIDEDDDGSVNNDNNDNEVNEVAEPNLADVELDEEERARLQAQAAAAGGTEADQAERFKRLAKAGTRQKKYNMANGYLRKMKMDFANDDRAALGGLELLRYMRRSILAEKDGDPAYSDVVAWADDQWQKRDGGPGTSFLVDWYPYIRDRIKLMSVSELRLIYRDCLAAQEQTPPVNLETWTRVTLLLEVPCVVEAATNFRGTDFVNNPIERACGFTSRPGSDVMTVPDLTQVGDRIADDTERQLITLRMQARSVGLKVSPEDQVSQLLSLHRRHKNNNNCSAKCFEFDEVLPSRFPIDGKVKIARGSKIEEGLDDFLMTSQSVSEAIYVKIAEAFRRYRFLSSLAALAAVVPDGRTCSDCGAVNIQCAEARTFTFCNHLLCSACQRSFNERDAKERIFDKGKCQMCLDSGHTSRLNHLPAQPAGLFCHGCKDTKITGPSGAYVLPSCGHMLCEACNRAVGSSSFQGGDGFTQLPRCIVDGCSAKLTSPAVRADKIVTARADTTISSLSPGAKVRKVIEIVSQARARGEKVLVFVAYQEQLQVVQDNLTAAGISVIRTDTAESDVHLRNFQQGRADVLLQRLCSVESAGSNLANANHIIFLGPLFSREQRDWDVFVGQAIGRCRRPGQTRDVHVYHLAAVNSLDVDVLEHHMKRKLRPDGDTEEMLLKEEEQEEVFAAGGVVDGDPMDVDVEEGEVIGSLLDSKEIEMLFRKKFDYKDTENIF